LIRGRKGADKVKGNMMKTFASFKNTNIETFETFFFLVVGEQEHMGSVSGSVCRSTSKALKVAHGP
jgi:hypothetical protein